MKNLMFILFIFIFFSCIDNEYGEYNNLPPLSFNDVNISLPSLNDGLISSHDFSSTDNITVYGASSSVDRFGNSNNAYYFDGRNDYITFNVNNQLKNITVSLWYKPLYPISTYPQLFKFDNIEFICMAGNHIAYIKNDNVGHIGSYPDGINSIPYIPTFNKWHNLVVTYNHDKNNHSIYVDGLLCKNKSTTQYLSCVGIVYIGNTRTGIISDGTAGYYGDMDDIKIWDRELTQNEIDYLSKN